MTSTRKQLADTIRHIRRNSLSNCFGREEVESHMDFITTEYNGVSLETLIEHIDPSEYSNVFVRGGSSTDWDGYPEGYVELYTYRKETDLEYFDRICQVILPTEYQQKQYQDYLLLKQFFEKDQS